jgi:hypothetical protein
LTSTIDIIDINNLPSEDGNKELMHALWHRRVIDHDVQSGYKVLDLSQALETNNPCSEAEE